MFEACPKREEIREKPHCFCIAAPFQHAIPDHRDVACCWCGVTKCQVAKKLKDPDHGPGRTVTVWDAP